VASSRLNPEIFLVSIRERFMSRALPFVMLALMLTAGMRASAWAQTAGAAGPLRMTIEGPQPVSPIAVSALKNLGGDDDHKVSSVFDATLMRDLKLSGFFSVIDPQSYIEDPQKSGYDIGQFNFGDWSSLNAEFLVKGAARRDGHNISVEVMLFSVGEQRRMMGKKFNGEPHDVSEMARRFADAVMQSVTGKRGPFDTKLAFVSTRGGRFKEVYTSWLDAGSLFRVTDNPTINLFPSFDHDVRHLLYLSYKTMSPALYIVDLGRGVETRIQPPLGMAVGGVLAPDGRIIAAFSRGGHTNLYLLDTSGSEIRALTDDRAINVSPSVCVSGDQMAFTSDRSGNPQIYVMSLGGGEARRLTYKGDYNTGPAFSPDCKKIAYENRIGGVFNLFVINADGGDSKQVTDEGSNEWPTWSPDSRYLAFSSTRGGRSHIYLELVPRAGEQATVTALTEGEGNDTSPSWSWWLGN
jgi:TolB protein